MINKKGAEKFNIIVSLILGLMVLAISLFWIFGEFFNQDELDWQVCRQSIILRNSLPEADLVAIGLDTKGAFPLKCKTEVVTIDSAKTPDEVYSKISDAVAEGWYMFGEGKMDFVGRETWKSQTVCMVFARIHFDENIVDNFYDENAFDWLKYFKEKYGSRIEVESLGDIRQEGFRDYYSSAKVGNTGKTYDKYLPLVLTNEPPEGGSLVVNWDSVKFSPDVDEDYLLVYMMNKASGYKGDEWFMSDAWEKTKVVAITTVDALDTIACDKFLTIPA